LELAVHELTTNAVKYGALSFGEGQVLVRWTMDHGTDGVRLALDWIEQNGPPVPASPQRGFGMTFIERGVSPDPRGEPKIAFRPTGVQARLSVPLRGRRTAPADMGGTA
jgi:two-component sensor histidine kinase